MKKSVLFSVLVTCFFSMIGAGTVQSQQMYKWTDKDGVIHFSETPPADQQAESSNIPSGPPLMGQAPVTDSSVDGMPSAAQQRREEISQNREQTQSEAMIIEAQCMAKQAEVARLEPNRRVFYTDENGETVRMDDQKRVDQVAAAKEFIRKNCS